MKRSIINIMGIIVLTVSAIGIMATAEAPPEKITLDSLKNLYQATAFDHKMHIDTGFECSKCHHKPFGEPMACEDCHDKPVKKESFNHEDHWGYDVGCDTCHQVDSTKALACSSCHKTPFDKENLHVVGLKGALHKQCMNCHMENGVGTSCKSCHEKAK